MSKWEHDRKHPGAEAVLFLSIENELLHFLNFLISNRAFSPYIGIKNRLKKERLVNQVLEETIGRIQAAEAKAAAEVEALRRRAAEKEPDVVDAVLRALV